MLKVTNKLIAEYYGVKENAAQRKSWDLGGTKNMEQLVRLIKYYEKLKKEKK